MYVCGLWLNHIHNDKVIWLQIVGKIGQDEWEQFSVQGAWRMWKIWHLFILKVHGR